MKGLKITGIVAAILFGAVLAIGMTIDGIVKSGIEDSGSAILKTDVEVEDIDISIFGAAADMDGFIVYNPEEFSDEPAISFEGIEIELDVKSLLSDRIIVNKIYVKNPEIFFEQTGAKVNLRELSNNINASPDDESEKTIIIKEFILEEGKLRISSELDKERTTEATIDRMVLKNIGETGSSTVQQAMRQILKPIIQDAISEAIQSGLLNQLEGVVEDIIDV